MTVLPRGRRQKLGLSSFADLTDVPVSTITKDAVTFDGDLSDEERALVWARLDSTDDDDQAARAHLRQLALEHPDCPLAVAVVAYVLGE